MEIFKKVGRIVFVATVSTLTSCLVQDMYKRYAHDDIAKAQFKNKIKGLNPFNKNK